MWWVFEGRHNSRLVIGGVFKILMVGKCGYVSLEHFVLWLTGVSNGIGGANCVNITRICRVLAMVFICCVCSLDPMGVFL